MIINWFNPVVYLYRYTIKHIHEYIADRQAVKTGTNKSDYALLLVSQTFNAPAHKLVNPFYNHSLLKLRIIMLQKNRSKRMALIKYGLSAPLFVLMLVLSSATVYNSKTVGFVNKKVDQVLLEPATQPDIIIDSTTMIKNPAAAPPLAVADKQVKTEEVSLTKTAKEAEADDSLPIFTSVEQVPQFVGGIDAFYTYLAKNIRYPAAMRDAGVQGRVILSFVVERDGSLTDVRITRGVADEIDQEALRVIKASPKWEPGVQNGRLVRVAYSVPISFNLVSYDTPPAAPMFLPPAQSNKAPALRINTSSTKVDTAVKRVPFDMKDLPANPLYIVNGVEVSNLYGLNPDNIESISVLRDKAATVIYGAKGAGGAVIVTSRKALFKTKSIQLLPKDGEKH
jgi:TonB family protein